MPAESVHKSSAPAVALNDARLHDLLGRFEAGEMRALAQLITMVENRAPESSAIIERIYAKTGRAQVVGITGPPGAGKSTLVNRLIAKYRASGKKIAILAIDPSSPFSGGAVLGDRVRMTDHYKDTGVYIRSLASRGSHGGLSRAAREIVKLLDAYGSDVIIIETVGVGQTELSIMDLADTTVVVTVPEAGDGVQVMKAGLNEIADVFVVNKADRPGVREARRDLEQMLDLSRPGAWRPEIVDTKATEAEGVAELWAAVSRHRDHLRETGRLTTRRQERMAQELRRVLLARAEVKVAEVAAGEEFASAVKALAAGELDPYGAADRLLDV
jgi:LAO/AO transport system kinase